jgi:hypothetical protein
MASCAYRFVDLLIFFLVSLIVCRWVIFSHVAGHSSHLSIFKKSQAAGVLWLHKKEALLPGPQRSYDVSWHTRTYAVQHEHHVITLGARFA